MIDLKHEIKREINQINPPDLWGRIQADALNGHAAVLDLTTSRRRRRPSLWVAVAAMVLLALVGALAVLDEDRTVDTTPVTEPTTSTTLPSIPLGDGPPLKAGTYRVSSEGKYDGPDAPRLLWSIVDYTITVPDGWLGHSGHYLSKHEDGEVDGDESDSLVIYPVLVDEIFADPCPGEAGPTVAVGPEVNDLIDALQAQPGPVTSEPVETTIGGLPATRIDLAVPEGADFRSCSLAPGLQIWFSDPSGVYFVLMPGYTASIYVVDVDGERQVFLTQHGPAASDEDLRELQSMLDSIRID